MTINGTKYEIISQKQICGFENRFEICLRKPKGKRFYHVVRYEDGSISGVV